MSGRLPCGWDQRGWKQELVVEGFRGSALAGISEIIWSLDQAPGVPNSLLNQNPGKFLLKFEIFNLETYVLFCRSSSKCEGGEKFPVFLLNLS